MKIEKKCIVCNKIMFFYPSELKQHAGKLCSKLCEKKWRSTGEFRNCKICDKKFYIQLSRMKRGWGNCCSRECFAAYFRNNGFGKKGGQTMHEKYKYMPHPLRGKKISEERRTRLIEQLKNRPMTDEWRESIRKSGFERRGRRSKIFGEKSHLWRGGVTPKNKIDRLSPRHNEWRISVFKRDNYICQKCGTKTVKLQAHHKKSFSQFPEFRFDTNNGITFCKPCHKKEHECLGDKFAHFVGL